MDFSQLVDSIFVEVSRPEMRVEITSFVNQTIRELHADPTTNEAVFYSENREEVEVTATVDTQQTWDIPSPHLLQRIETVYYTEAGRYASEESPATAFKRSHRDFADEYWYKAGTTLAFSGYGGIGSTIKISRFNYLRGLIYYPKADRPVTWDIESQSWTYHPSYVGDESTADRLSTNWMLSRHAELVKQGAKAKVYAALSNVDRARTAYSMYKTLAPMMIGAESYELGSRGE